MNCLGLNEITIPASVISLEHSMFGQNMENINIEQTNPAYKSVDGVIYTKDGATLVEYPKAKNTDIYNIENGTINIEKEAFKDAKLLKKVVLPDGLKNIRSKVFYNSGLRGISLPESVTSIEERALVTSNIQNISVSESNTEYRDENGNLYSKNLETLIQHPAGNIGDTCIIPEQTTKIGEYSFENCNNIISIEIPETVLEIGNRAFFNSEKIQNVTILNPTAIIGINILEQANVDASITGYKDSTAESYAKANGITFVETVKKYAVSFYDNGNLVSEQKVEEGTAAIEPIIQKPGYILSWDKDFSNITSDLIVNAVWTNSLSTVYTIEHYQQNIELNNYELAESQAMTAETYTEVIAVANSYIGFTENKTHEERIIQGIVDPNGSLILKLYYDRNIYNVKLETNGGTMNSENITKYIYGKETNLPLDITKDGQRFIGWHDNVSLIGNAIPKILATDIGDKTYYANWTKAQYTVEFRNDGEIIKTQGVNHGENAIPPEIIRPGYILNWDKSYLNVTQDLVINTVWTPEVNISYTVEHYKENIDKTGYDKEETEKLIGGTGNIVTAIAKEYKGFTEDKQNIERIESGEVKSDGSLVLKLYYNRNIYNVLLVSNGGTINSGNISNYVYGRPEILPKDITKIGYGFGGWYDNSTFIGNTIDSILSTDTGDKTYYAKWNIGQHTVIFKDGDKVVDTQSVNHGSSANPPELIKSGYVLNWDKNYSDITEDLVVNAVWIPSTNTPYKVEHYKQNTSLNSYELVDTENLTGTTDKIVTAVSKKYTGFSENTTLVQRVPSGAIKGDGSLLLKLYYDRNSYKVILNTNGGTINSGNISTYIYGIGVTLPQNVTKSGFRFEGWYDNSVFMGSNIINIGNEETGEKAYYAKWSVQEKEDYYIRSKIYKIDNTYIEKVSPQTNKDKFISNIETNGEITKITNAKGEILEAQGLVTTGSTLYIEYEGTTYTYKIVVKGDLDKNGKLTITDLSMLNQGLTGGITLDILQEKAGDLDFNNKMTITDLSIINQAIVGFIEL